MHSCVANDHYRHAPHEQSPAAAPRHPIDHSASAAAATGKRSQSHLADGAYTALKWPTGSDNGIFAMWCIAAFCITVAFVFMFLDLRKNGK